jgi:hydroxymethylpyrimidine/phosphomethylpyrimidine kinase
MRCALTIAGSDSSGGAGIQADIKTFAAFGVYGASAVTAITAQNTRHILSSVPLAPDLVAAQIDAIATDFDLDATKIGMLATASIVDVVASAIERRTLRRVVLDPVFVSSSGHLLLDAPGVERLRTRLLPLAAVITPNADEAAALSGVPVRTVADARIAAHRLIAIGARAVVITGGHLEGGCVDIIFEAGVLTELRGERIAADHTHGTGCTFSSALAARLALGDELVAAARAAKQYVADAIRRAPGLGRGSGPLGHF